MVAQGFEAWWPSEKLAVFGYLDALRHYRELVGIRSQLRERLLRERPDVFIGVDAPDFNFGLEDAAARSRHPDGALRVPFHLGLAWRAGEEAGCVGRPRAVPVPF